MQYQFLPIYIWCMFVYMLLAFKKWICKGIEQLTIQIPIQIHIWNRILLFKNTEQLIKNINEWPFHNSKHLWIFQEYINVGQLHCKIIKVSNMLDTIKIKVLIWYNRTIIRDKTVQIIEILILWIKLKPYVSILSTVMRNKKYIDKII